MLSVLGEMLDFAVRRADFNRYIDAHLTDGLEALFPVKELGAGVHRSASAAGPSRNRRLRLVR
jgi:hypothetical protein